MWCENKTLILTLIQDSWRSRSATAKQRRRKVKGERKMGKRGRKWEVMEKREEARRLPQNMERLRRAAQEQEEATGRLRPQFHCLLQIPGRTSTSHPPGKTFTHLRTGAFFVPTAWQLSSLIMLILLFQQPTATCQCPLKLNEIKLKPSSQWLRWRWSEEDK